MRRLLLPFVSVLLLNGSVMAETVIWGSQNGSANWLAEHDGATLLPVNNFVRLGYFNGFTSLAQLDSFISSNKGTTAGLQTINSSFNQIDFDQIGADSFHQAGVFANSANIVNPDSNLLVGKQLVILAYLSTDNSSLANALSHVTQFGAFYFDASSNGNWAIKSDLPTTSSATIDIGDLKTPSAPPGTLNANAHIPAGAFASTTISGAHPFILDLVTVPEPSTFGFTIGGLFGLLGWHRLRRRS